MDQHGVAVVTGAASGFGLAVAHELAARGYSLGLLDRDGDRLATEAATLAARHDATELHRIVDVATAADLDAAAAEVGSQWGHCDVLWVNVGVQHFGAVETLSDDVLRWVLDINVGGALRTVRAFLPLLRNTTGARIAFTASANVLAPAARLGAYQASKFALMGLAETLRMELAPESIGVSVVFPSGMLTRHLESSADARPAALGSGAVADADLNAMMASRPMSEADLATAEAAAERAVAGVLAGEPYVITHGDLAHAVETHHAEIRRAIARLAQ